MPIGSDGGEGNAPPRRVVVPTPKPFVSGRSLKMTFAK